MEHDLTAVQKDPFLLRRKSTVDRIKVAQGLKNDDELSRYLFSFAGGTGEPVTSLDLIDVQGDVVHSRGIRTFGGAESLKGDLPRSVQGRVHRALTTPAVRIIEESSPHAISVSGGIPIVLRRSDLGIISPISSPAYFAANLRGGKSAFRDVVVTVDRVAIIHDHFGANNFAHWMLDWMPRLLLLAKERGVGDCSFVFWKNPTIFQQFFLSLVGIKKSQIIVMPESEIGVVACQSVIGTNLSGPDQRHPCQHGSKWVLDLFDHYPARDEGFSKRILVNRRGTRKLKLTEKTKQRLERCGFVEYFLEDMTNSQQIALFRNAESVIAQHGAGLANLVFAPFGYSILEIFPQQAFPTAAFFVLADSKDASYFCAVADSLPTPEMMYDPDITLSGDVIDGFLESLPQGRRSVSEDVLAVKMGDARFTAVRRVEGSPSFEPFWARVTADAWEPETITTIAQFCNDETVFLDVGAWVGATALYASSRGAKVYAFEPDPIAIAAFQANMGLNPSLAHRIDLIQSAVGDTSGTLELFAGFQGNSETSIFNTVERAGNVKEFGKKFTVGMVNLIEFVGKIEAGRDIFIKMDIEGAEFDLLPKIHDVCSSRQARILVELHGANIVKATDEDTKFARQVAICSALKDYSNFSWSDPKTGLQVNKAEMLDHLMRSTRSSVLLSRC